MTHTFDTIADAIVAGYETATTRSLEIYQGFDIRIVDTSGPRSFGYSFGVKGVPTDETLRQGKQAVGPFGSTVDVWLTQERNKAGKLGAASAMFPPDELERAIAEVKAHIEIEV